MLCYTASMRVDFTNCPLSNISYSGADKKQGIVFAGANWMIKFAKMGNYGEINNDVSEYLGSKIFSLLGFHTQEVLLGLYQGQKVVACKDFMTGKAFTPFSDVGESSLDGDKHKYIYSYNDIVTLINKNKRINDKKEAITLFWKTYIIDALLANRDRHGKNWGFIKKNNKYEPAPIFDNGDSLFAAFVDKDELTYVLENEADLLEYVYDTPRSVIKNDEGLNDYYSVISSKKYHECNQAILSLSPLIEEKLNEMMLLIDNVDLIEIKKSFLKRIINLRFELIIKKTYQELLNNERNN